MQGNRILNIRSGERKDLDASDTSVLRAQSFSDGQNQQPQTDTNPIAESPVKPYS